MTHETDLVKKVKDIVKEDEYDQIEAVKALIQVHKTVHGWMIE